MVPEAAKNKSWMKTPLAGVLLCLVLAVSLLLGCKDDKPNSEPNAEPEPEPMSVSVLCTVGDDSPCALWQRCVATDGAQGDQGHCVGERQCETNDSCPLGRTCEGGTCAPSFSCEMGCPPGEYVCVSSSANCQRGCFLNGDCSGSRVCGGHDTTTGLGTCRNPQ